MNPRVLFGILLCVSGCGTPPPEAPDPDFYLEPSAGPAPDSRPSKYCARLQHAHLHAYCTLEVDAETLARRGGYELTYQEGRLIKACPAGWRSQHQLPDDNSCLHYDYAGEQLVRVREVTNGGRVLADDRLSQQGRRVEYGSGHGPRAVSEDVFGARLELDQRGRLTREAFLDADGSPTPDALGRYQLKYAYDERGEVRELQALDAHGTPAVDDRGVCIERYTRFSSGALKQEAYFDAEGQPVDADGRYQRQVSKRDEYGRLLEEERFRADGKPATFEDGYVKRRVTYRERRSEQLYLDAEGAPFRAAFGGSRLVGIYDQSERPYRMEVFHLGRYVERPGGFSILEIKYGEHSIERRFFGRDRKLVRGRTAIQVYDYTSDDFVRSRRYFDSDRKPALWGDAAAIEYAYTDGKLSEDRSFGTDGKLLEKGIPVKKYDYDELGRVKERRGFDRDGNELPLIASWRISFKLEHEGNADLEAAKAAATARARAVWRRITEDHMSFTRAFRTYDEFRTDQSAPEVHVEVSDPESLGAHLEIGGVSEPVEWQGAIHIYQRVP